MAASTPSGYVPGFLSKISDGIEGVPALFAYFDSSNNPNWGAQWASKAAGATGGDSLNTIKGSNYFSDGQKRGLALGCFVLILTDQASVGTDVGYLSFVSAVQATSAGYGATVTLISTA